MTNGEKFDEIIRDTFGEEFKEVLGSLDGCRGINCLNVKDNSASCKKCKYNDFWGKEYKSKENEINKSTETDPWWLMLDDLYQKAMNGDTHSKDVYLAMDAGARHFYESHISCVRSIIGNMLRKNNDYKKWAEKLHINYDNYPCTLIR